MHPAFQVHRLNQIGLERAAMIAEAFDELVTKLDDLIPAAGREKSIVITKLEEASFFAKKAMAVHPANQQ